MEQAEEWESGDKLGRDQVMIRFVHVVEIIFYKY